MDLEKHIGQGKAAVNTWLDQHVQRYKTPTSITLSKFEVDWESFEGHFHLELDSLAILQPFTFSPDISGKPKFYIPLFHSPLGTPASYSGIELTELIRISIDIYLSKTIPRIGPNGNATLETIQQAQSKIDASEVKGSIIEAYLEWLMMRKKCIPYHLEWLNFQLYINSKLPEGISQGAPITFGDNSSYSEKLKKLGEQLEIAEQYDFIDEAYRHLENLPRKDWQYRE